MAFDIWHLTSMKVLAALAFILIILIILAQSFTDGFCGYLGNLKKWGNWIHLCGLRDASASKNLILLDAKDWEIFDPANFDIWVLSHNYIFSAETYQYLINLCKEVVNAIYKIFIAATSVHPCNMHGGYFWTFDNRYITF